MPPRRPSPRLLPHVLLLLLVGCGASGSGGTNGGSAPVGFPPGIGTWIERLNQLRGWAGLDPVAEDAMKSAADAAHSNYLVLNCETGHAETMGNPGYTAEGAEAGMKSNVVVGFGASMTDEEALRSWMTGPFHGIAMLDPRLTSSGFGTAFDGAKECLAGFTGTYAASLWVDFGLGGVPGGTSYPILWPGAGVTIDLLSYEGSEFPDPLTGCPPGWTAPTGLPIYMQLGVGTGSSPPPGLGATFFGVTGGPGLEHCAFHWGDYANPDGSTEMLGRSILEARRCVVLMPRAPLVAGTSYTVGLTVDGTPTSWSFATSGAAAKPAIRSKAVIRPIR